MASPNASYVERFVDRLVLETDAPRVGAYCDGCNGEPCRRLKTLAERRCRDCGKPLGFLRLYHDYGTHVVHKLCDTRLCDTRYTISPEGS